MAAISAMSPNGQITAKTDPQTQGMKLIILLIINVVAGLLVDTYEVIT